MELTKSSWYFSLWMVYINVH